MRRDPDERRDCPAPRAADGACWRRAGRPVEIALAGRRMTHPDEYHPVCGQVSASQRKHRPESGGRPDQEPQPPESTGDERAS